MMRRVEAMSWILRRWTRLRVFLWVGLLPLLMGYTWKRAGTQKDPDAAPPPYLRLAEHALRQRDQVRARRFLKAARRCWVKRRRLCGFFRADLLLHEGILALQSSSFKQAVKVLARARKALKDKHPKSQPRSRHKTPSYAARRKRVAALVPFYLGQGLFQAGHFKRAVSALRQAASVGQAMAGYHVLLTRGLMRLGALSQARRALAQGLSRFPKDRALARLSVLIYVQAGAWHPALQRARRLYLAAESPEIHPFLIVIDAMRKKGLIFQLLPLLERARARWPRHRGVLLRLASLYRQARLPLASAHHFSTLAQMDPKMAYQAAAAWSLGGRTLRALAWNARVKDPGRRLKQRTEILLRARRYVQAFALLKRRWKARQIDASGRYQLAHLAIRLGRFRIARAMLQLCKSTHKQAELAPLRRALGICQASPWRCAFLASP